MIEQHAVFDKSQKLKLNQLSSQKSYSTPNNLLHNKHSKDKQTIHTSFSSLSQYLQFFSQNFSQILQASQLNISNQQLQSFKKVILLPQNKQTNVFSKQNKGQKSKQNKGQSKSTNQQIKNIQSQIYKLASQIHLLANQIVSQKVLSSTKFRKSNHFTNKLIINELSHSRNNEIINLQLEFLSFKTQVQILNQSSLSPFHIHGRVHSSGTFANIYYANDKGCQIAVKCTSLTKNTVNTNRECGWRQKSQIVATVLKQYFLLLLFSQLKIGPHHHKLTGFDLILYDECIQFAMQKVYCPSQNMEYCVKQIKQDLFQMHMLKVVHRDIKTIHICYSNTYQKWVFLDFGLSEVIKQVIGERTSSQYRGTVSYSSQQLLQLLSKTYGYVDLYFNDLYGLMKSFEEKNQRSHNIQKNNFSMNEYYSFLIAPMKYHLYHSEFMQFMELWNYAKKQFIYDSLQIQIKVLDFFSQLYPNQQYKQLSQFYFNQIQENIRESSKFTAYKSIFKRQINHLHYYLHDFPLKKSKMKTFQLIFENLKLQYSRLDIKEKAIKKIVKSKKRMQEYLSNKLEEIETAQFQPLQQYQNQIQLFIVAIYYTCLTENPNHIEIKAKIQIAQKLANLIQKRIQSENGHLSFIFKCDQQNLEPISILFHYFVFKIWQKVPLFLKSELTVLSVSTLCLLGYPVSDKILDSYLIYHLIKGNKNSHNQIKDQNIVNFSDNDQSQANEKIKYIMIYWQSRLVFLIFENIYHLTNNLPLPDSFYEQSLVKILEKTIKQLMTFTSNHYSQFWTLNKMLYELVINDYLKFDLNIFYHLLSLLKSSPIEKLCKQNIKIKRWRSIMNILLFYVRNIYSSKDPQTVLTQMKDNFLNQFLSTSKIVPYNLYFIFNDLCQTSQGLSIILVKIDDILKNDVLTIKFETYNRLKLSFINKDFQKLQTIIEFICKLINKHTFFIEDVQLMFKILQIIIDLFICDYLLSLPSFTQQSTSFFFAVYKIVNVSLQIGHKVISQIDNQSHKKNLFESLTNSTNYVGCINDAMRQTIKVTGFLSSLCKVGKFFYKFIQILPQNMLKSHQNIFFQTKHLNLLKKLEHESCIYSTATQWIEYIKENQIIRKSIFQNRPLSVFLVRLLVNHRKTSQQVLQTQKIINQLFGGVFIEGYLNQNAQQNLPSLRIAFDYIHINLVKTNYDSEWCQKIINLYWICHDKKFFDKFIFSKSFIRILFNSFVYANKSFQEMALFLSKFSMLLKYKPTKKKIMAFIRNLRFFFWCKCKQCFPRQPIGWDVNNFTEFLFLKINDNNPCQNPYFSFVYLYSMTSKEPKIETVRKILRFISKSIPQLNLIAKQMIMGRIYFYVYLGFTPQPENKLIFLGENKNELSIERISKSEMKKKKYQRLFYFYMKVKKHQQKTQDNLQQLLEKMLFKQIYVKDYVYPKNIKEIYMKKLEKYFKLKQNYRKKSQMAELDQFVRNPQISSF